MSKGTVKWFSSSKGYGFITTEEGKDIFVHYSEIQSEGYKVLNEGDNVVFDVVDGIKGQQATKVTKVEEGKEAPRGSNPSKGKEVKTR